MVDLRKLSMATRSNEISEVQIDYWFDDTNPSSSRRKHGKWYVLSNWTRTLQVYMSKLKPDSNGNTYFQRGKNSVRPKNKVICLSRKSAYHDERSHIQTSDVRDNFSRQSPWTTPIRGTYETMTFILLLPVARYSSNEWTICYIYIHIHCKYTTPYT